MSGSEHRVQTLTAVYFGPGKGSMLKAELIAPLPFNGDQRIDPHGNDGNGAGLLTAARQLSAGDYAISLNFK